MNCTVVLMWNSVLNIHWKLKLQYFGHLMRRTDSLEKTLMLGKIEGRRRGRQKMNGITNAIPWFEWHHRFNVHESEQAPEVDDGQGSWCAAVHGVAESQT